jgi:hypothetical protein
MNEYITYIKQQKRKSDLHEMINSELIAIRSINNKKHAAQDAVNERLMHEIAAAQGEIAKKAIRLWKEEQLARTEDDLNSFITSSNLNIAATNNTVLKSTPKNGLKIQEN